jgi:hypothetical protein
VPPRLVPCDRQAIPGGNSERGPRIRSLNRATAQGFDSLQIPVSESAKCESLASARVPDGTLAAAQGSCKAVCNFGESGGRGRSEVKVGVRVPLHCGGRRIAGFVDQVRTLCT